MVGRLVPLTVYDNVVEAKVCISMLHAHGIYTFAPLEFVSVAPLWMTAHQGIEIWIVDSDYADAALLLDLAEKETAAEISTLPKRYRVLEGISGLVVMGMFGVPPAPAPACGRSQLHFSGPLAIAAMLMAFLQ